MVTGNWITPSEEAFKAAGAAADWSKSYYQILTNQGDRAAWPIAGATFILVPEKSEKLEQIKLSVKFFDWAFNNGDKAAAGRRNGHAAARRRPLRRARAGHGRRRSCSRGLP